MYLKTLVGKPVYIYVVLIFGIGAPFHFELNSSLNFVVPSVAFAKGGDGGGGSDGGGDSDGGSDSDGGNSGSGSDGGNSGSGSDGGNSGSGSDDGNENSGSDDGSKSNSRSGKRSQNAISHVERGSGLDIEVHYNNGWTEQIKSGLYELRDNINRKVIGRDARQDDYDRFRDISPDR